MSNFGPALAKLTVIATGAVIGVLLARWYEEVRSTQVERQHQRDKARYAEGLVPVGRRHISQEYEGGQAS